MGEAAGQDLAPVARGRQPLVAGRTGPLGHGEAAAVGVGPRGAPPVRDRQVAGGLLLLGVRHDMTP